MTGAAWTCRSPASAPSPPGAIREASPLLSFGHDGAHEFEDDVTCLTADQGRIDEVAPDHDHTGGTAILAAHC